MVKVKDAHNKCVYDYKNYEIDLNRIHNLVVNN